MTSLAQRQNWPVHDALHPVVYKAMFGLTVWLVLSIWALFGTASYAGLIFAMVTLFFLIFTAIPLLLALTWRRNADPHELRGDSETFRDWTGQEFPTWTGPLSGHEAAMHILLPLAAVSLGMTVFGLVYYFDVPHAGY